MKYLIAIIAGLIAGPVLLLIGGMLGLLGTSGTAEPPGWEVSLGGRLLDSALEARAKGLANPVKADDRQALARGGQIYALNSAGCHGDAKATSIWGSRNFYPRVPQFWQQRESVLTPEEAFAAIHDGIRYSGMGAWKGMMSA